MKGYPFEVQLPDGLPITGVILVGWSATAWIVLPGADLPRHVALMLLIWLVYVGALCFVVGQKGRGGTERTQRHCGAPEGAPQNGSFRWWEGEFV